MTYSHIFVFASNRRGVHGAGSALEARKRHGAVLGQGVGLQGNSYAIPTKGDKMEVLPLDVIKMYVDEFLAYARANPTDRFEVVKIGCGLAGYTEADIAPMFSDAPKNCNLPPGWGPTHYYGPNCYGPEGIAE